MYLGELDDDLDTDLILEVMLLADHYEIEGLFLVCGELLREIVNPENAVYIYQHTRVFERAEVNKIAMDCILR